MQFDPPLLVRFGYRIVILMPSAILTTSPSCTSQVMLKAAHAIKY